LSNILQRIHLAIATCNAVIAGMIVLQAVKILESKIDSCREVNLRVKPVDNRLIVSNSLTEPNKNCVVCAEKPTITIKMNTTKVTRRFLEGSKLLYGRFF